MKLLFLTSLYPPHARGGGEISTQLLAEGLVARGHNVTVITSTGSGERQRQEKVMAGVRVIYLPLPFTAKPLFERRHASKMARALVREGGVTLTDFDFVHAHDFRSALLVYELVQQGVIAKDKIVVTARDYAQLCGSPNNLQANGMACDDCARLTCIIKNQAIVEAPLIRKPFRVWQYWFNIGYRRQAFLASPRQVFISHPQQQEIQRIQNTAHQQTAVIYNPVAEIYFTSNPRPAMNSTIVYVGRVQKYKGVELLLQAWRVLLTTHPDVQLHIVGEGAQKLEYEQLVSQWGLQYQVKFTGAVAYDRVMELYDEATVVVAPHLWREPFGRTVAEAMARGRLVVAADTGGPAELITHGQTGFLFTTGSVEALAETLVKALSLPDIDRREIEQNARQWTQEHLAVDNIAMQYEDFYQSDTNLI